MKSTITFLVAIIFGTIGKVDAVDEFSDRGMWPKSWPAELEPLGKQSRTISSGDAMITHHEIPFSKQGDFESAWPHLLKVKSKGAPVVLRRGPHDTFGRSIKAGVLVFMAAQKENGDAPAVPIRGQSDVRMRWLSTTYIELIVDGQIVDLNRISLTVPGQAPPETPIIDLRFEDVRNK